MSLLSKIIDGFASSLSNAKKQETPFISLEQLSREGRLYRVGSLVTTGGFPGTTRAMVTPGYSTAIATAGYTVPVGRASLLLSWGASSDIEAAVNLTINQGYFSALIGSIGQQEIFFGSGGGQESVPCRTWIYEGGRGLLNGFAIGKMDGAATTGKPNIGLQYEQLEVTADFRYDAKFRVLQIGDSIDTGGMGNDPSGNPYIGKDLYPFIITDWLNTLGISCRLINKAVAGENSRHVRQRANAGLYSDNADLIICKIGVNDIPSTTVTVAEYKENLKSVIDMVKRTNPKASIVFLCPGTTDLTTVVANIASYRAACQEVATTAAYYGGGTANRVYFYDPSTAFSLNATATADTNFQIVERVAGARLHWSGAGHALVAAGLKPVIQTTKFYTDNI